MTKWMIHYKQPDGKQGAAFLTSSEYKTPTQVKDAVENGEDPDMYFAKVYGVERMAE